MTTNQRVVAHLLALFDGVYYALGHAAPTLSNDAYVICVHDLSRIFGEVALELRSIDNDEVTGPWPIVEGVLSAAHHNDETGAMLLYAMSMVVGPRILVSLLDARTVVDSEELRTTFDAASQRVVSSIHAIGEVARHQPVIDDEAWQLAARDLSEMLEMAGHAESFGITH